MSTGVIVLLVLIFIAVLLWLYIDYFTEIENNKH